MSITITLTGEAADAFASAAGDLGLTVEKLAHHMVGQYTDSARKVEVSHVDPSPAHRPGQAKVWAWDGVKWVAGIVVAAEVTAGGWRYLVAKRSALMSSDQWFTVSQLRRRVGGLAPQARP